MERREGERMKFILKCKDVYELLPSDETERPLTTQFRLKIHLSICDHCRRYQAQLAVLKANARLFFGLQRSDETEKQKQLEDEIIAMITKGKNE